MVVELIIGHTSVDVEALLAFSLRRVEHHLAFVVGAGHWFTVVRSQVPFFAVEHHLVDVRHEVVGRRFLDSQAQLPLFSLLPGIIEDVFEFFKVLEDCGANFIDHLNYLSLKAFSGFLDKLNLVGVE